LFTPQVIVLIVLVFFVLVGIHEWGHYYFAKRAGILVREFAIGFGPKLFSFKKKETTYTFRLLPIGGFVRMAGEDPEVVRINPGQTIVVDFKEDEITHIYLDQLEQRTNGIRGVVQNIDLERELYISLETEGDVKRYKVHPQAMMATKGKETQIAPWDRQFGSKTVAQRALAIFAGPLMNFLLAFALFVSLIYLTGVPVENPTYLKISKVVENSVAEKADLQKGDIVFKVNGETIGADREKLVNMIGESAGRKMEWIVVRDRKQVKLEVIPDKVEGKVGIGLALPTRQPSFGETLSVSADRMIMSSQQIFIGLKTLVTLQANWEDLGGPVRIIEFTGEAASLGIPTLVYWTAILSLYLGIFNLLPFPALDGSRLVFLGFEALRGKPVDPNKESIVHFIGFAMLMLLMLAVTYNDILRLFKG
jgi:regulator of sigma E protease